MKLKELKKKLDSLTPKELNQKLLFNSVEYSISGEVKTAGKSTKNLYYTGEDDPAPLYTLKELKEKGMDKEEIEECSIEIAKGDFVINI